ncbi:MAG: metallophosphoesterase family protein, partial [Treponema sp.]|nr:metallophosphoesterase family protein [Treponema sp.]
MKLLAISDLHGNLSVLDKMAEIFKEADAVLFAGDFAKFGDSSTGLPALEKLCSMHESIYAVIGNCDEPVFLEELEKRDVSVEKILSSHDGLSITGSGGGSKFTGTTPFERTDEELLSDFAMVTQQDAGEWNNLIAIMHNPPKDTKCDTISGGVHVGSPLLRKFIED